MQERDNHIELRLMGLEEKVPWIAPFKVANRVNQRLNPRGWRK